MKISWLGDRHFQNLNFRSQWCSDGSHFFVKSKCQCGAKSPLIKNWPTITINTTTIIFTSRSFTIKVVL